MAFPRPHPAPSTSLAAVAACAGASASIGDVTVTGVTLNSREVQPGDLYAALPGTHTHGASFAGPALGAGAAAVLTDPSGHAMLARAGLTVPEVVTPDPRAVLGRVAALVYGTGVDLPVRTYGITGTNGKTTTAYLIGAALSALGRSIGLIGTIETRIADERIRSVRTTPEATDLHALLAVMAQRGVGACVMEVSSHALELHRVDGVVYDTALFTNLSQDHLDFHGGMEPYFAAKASLFTPERSRQGIVCVDDEWGQRLAREASVPLTTVTSRQDVEADWRVISTDEEDRAEFQLASVDQRLSLRSPLPGDFNRTNTAMAAVVLLTDGVSSHEVERATRTDPQVPGRMERISLAGHDDERLPLVVVDFAHTPEAVSAALTALRPGTSGALVVVLGAGGDRDRGKRPQMGRAAALAADIVFVTDDNPRSEEPSDIRTAVLEGARLAGSGALLRDVAGRGEAIRGAVLAAVDAGVGSTVVVVGKGHETGQEIEGAVHPFDDREEVLKALREASARRGGRS